MRPASPASATESLAYDAAVSLLSTTVVCRLLWLNRDIGFIC